MENADPALVVGIARNMLLFNIPALPIARIAFPVLKHHGYSKLESETLAILASKRRGVFALRPCAAIAEAPMELAAFAAPGATTPPDPEFGLLLEVATWVDPDIPFLATAQNRPF